MSKTLVIAEKPSVGRDLSRVLAGPFTKHEGYLEGPEHVLTWAVVLIRALHIGAVVVALAAMYRPAANAYFRS